SPPSGSGRQESRATQSSRPLSESAPTSSWWGSTTTASLRGSSVQTSTPRFSARLDATSSWLERTRHRSVLVVSADPRRCPLLVAAFLCSIGGPVIAHEELETASGGSVGLVQGVVVADERAEPRALGEVARDIGATRSRTVLDARWRSRVEHGREALACLLLRP